MLCRAFWDEPWKAAERADIPPGSLVSPWPRGSKKLKENCHSSPWGGRVQDSKEKGGLFQVHWQEACFILYYRHFAAQLLWWLGKNNMSPLRGSNSWKNGYQLKQIDTWYNRPDFYRQIKNLGIPWQHLKRYKCSTKKIFLELETMII